MMSYDHWKTTNPEDEWLGPEPKSEEEPPEKTLGQIAYERYWAQHLLTGIKACGWEQLDAGIRAGWEKCAAQIIEELE
jgi:hypothetical protein